MQSFKYFLCFVAGFIFCFITVGIIPLTPLPPIDMIKITEDSAATMASLSTVAIALLTFVIASETITSRFTKNYQIEAMRKEEIRPFIEMFIEQSKSDFQVFNVRVENVGKGIAQNISFVLTEKEELSKNQSYLLKELEKLDFFKNGIKILGNGKARSSFLFNAYELYKDCGEKAFEACLSFKVVSHDHEGFQYATPSIIDLYELKDISQADEIVKDKQLSVKVFQQTKDNGKTQREVGRKLCQQLNLSTNPVSKYIKSKLGR